ncbi:MAG: ATP-binding protein [Myxococcales bacterium]|nr:ATP-binding protein [Myxococcales bacterium]
MVDRSAHLDRIRWLFRTFPVVGVVGARQVGKTWLGGQVARHERAVARFDLESPADRVRLGEPLLALEPLRGLVVIDEVQRMPDLFPVLRVLVDRPRRPARFLILGSATPDLLRQSSETLAGRIAYHELGGLDLGETGAARLSRLWQRGGFPRSFLAATDAASFAWREQFVSTFLERDLGALGFALPPNTIGRFWTMLAHYHGQIWNGAELARAFGISESTVRRYLDALAGTFMVRQLRPWSENLGKRQVKTPKVYVSDGGILHALLQIRDARALDAHPKVGASWEGFMVEQLARRLGATGDECHFWATHQGAELDLLVVRGRVRRAFEIKRTVAPAVTRSMHVALADLGLDSLDVVHAGRETFPLAPRIRAVAAVRLLEDVAPLG